MQETITLQDGTLVQVADFDFGFVLDGKAVVNSEEDGTLVLEGFASDFGLDRQDEAFEPGSFEAGIKAYMQNPVVCYHHKTDTAMGSIKSIEMKPEGMWVKAEIPKPEPGTDLMNYYKQIKDGVLRGFSVGGKFYRRMTAAGQRIFKCDLREISVTPLPVNPRTLFAVAGKAFDNMETPETDTTDLDLLAGRLDAIASIFTAAEKQMEGKASQRPDGPHIEALQYHLQKIHTLALNAKQDKETSNELTNRAESIANDAEKHSKGLHHLAAKHGPLSGYYASSNI